MSVALETLVAHLDTLLATATTPDYPPALNGLQVQCRRPIARIAAAVDAS